MPRIRKSRRGVVGSSQGRIARCVFDALENRRLLSGWSPAVEPALDMPTAADTSLISSPSSAGALPEVAAGQAAGTAEQAGHDVNAGLVDSPSIAQGSVSTSLTDNGQSGGPPVGLLDQASVGLATGVVAGAGNQISGPGSVADRGLTSAVYGSQAYANRQAVLSSLLGSLGASTRSNTGGGSSLIGASGAAGRAPGGSASSAVLNNLVAALTSYLSRSLGIDPSRITVTVSDGRNTGASNDTTSSPATTSSASNVVSVSTSVVVVVVTVGRGQILLFFPLAATETSTASNNPTAEQPVDLEVELPPSKLTILSKFGQSEKFDSLTPRSRSGSDSEVSAIFDLVEPETPAPQPRGVPAAASRAVDDLDVREFCRILLPPLPATTFETVETDRAAGQGVGPEPSGARIALEPRLPELTPRLAVAGTLVGAACTLSLRGMRSRREQSSGSGRGFRPTVRPRFLPLR